MEYSLITNIFLFLQHEKHYARYCGLMPGKLLLCARCHAECFMWAVSFSAHNSSVKELLLDTHTLTFEETAALGRCKHWSWEFRSRPQSWAS